MINLIRGKVTGSGGFKKPNELKILNNEVSSNNERKKLIENIRSFDNFTNEELLDKYPQNYREKTYVFIIDTNELKDYLSAEVVENSALYRVLSGSDEASLAIFREHLEEVFNLRGSWCSDYFVKAASVGTHIIIHLYKNRIEQTSIDVATSAFTKELHYLYDKELHLLSYNLNVLLSNKREVIDVIANWIINSEITGELSSKYLRLKKNQESVQL